MTVQTFYRPPRYDQLKGPVLTRKNDCGPASVKVAIRRWSLSSQDPTIYAIRKAMERPTGQTDIYDQAEAFRHFGVPVVGVYDRFDDFSIAALTAHLRSGNYATCLGDYDEIPAPYSGDPNFDGNHLVMLNEWTVTGPLVYDPVADGRRAGIPKAPIVWPWSLLTRYLHNLSDRPDLDITVCLLKRRTVKRRLDSVTVYERPSKLSAVVGNWHTGPLEYGALTRDADASAPPYPAWYRVWWPYTARIAFVQARDVELA